MVTVPENEITQADLEKWYKLANELKSIKAQEILLRKKIFAGKFPDPIEGTNTCPLEDGWVLKGTYSLDRAIDQGAFDAIKEKLEEENVSPDSLVQYKPSLVKRAYNTLTAEQRNLFDQCLIIKPGSPSMTIVLPASAKKE